MKYLLAIIVFLSGIVFIEPAPVDLLVIAVAVLLLASQGCLIGTRTTGSVFAVAAPLVALGLIGFMVIVFGTATPYAIFKALVLLYLVVMTLFLVYILVNEVDIGIVSLMNVYVMAAVVFVIFGVADFYDISDFDNRFMKFGRLTGLFKDPNVFSPYLVPPVVYILYRIMARRNPIPVFNGFLLLILFSGILLAGSRGGLLNLAIAVATLLILMQRGDTLVKLFRRGTLVMLGSLGLIAIAIWLDPAITEYMADRLAVQSYDYDRFHYQHQALLMSLANPWGHGPGQAESVLGYATHNTYLRLWLEYGLPGLLAYLFFLYLTLVNFVRLARDPASGRDNRMMAMVAAATIIGIMANGLVIDTHHWRHFWILVALGWAAVLREAHGERGVMRIGDAASR